LTRSATAFSVAAGFFTLPVFFERGFIPVTSSRGPRLNGRSLDSKQFLGPDCISERRRQSNKIHLSQISF
ncbi:MAG: hypothetical protein WCF88_02705, partial [Candidatus Acidiferrales bacterium]